jgi:hypothetical protein
MSDTDRAWAIKRIRAKRGFWIHFGIYLAVNALLVVVWAVTWTDYFWPVWPMLGWGIGVVAHALTVFTGGMAISEARIQREIDRRG